MQPFETSRCDTKSVEMYQRRTWYHEKTYDNFNVVGHETQSLAKGLACVKSTVGSEFLDVSTRLMLKYMHSILLCSPVSH